MERKGLLEYRVAGVSFRADSVGKVKVGQQVLICKEPSNPYDSNAVRVTTLNGDKLGYIPKSVNQEFLHEIITGRVSHVGRDESQPDLPLGMKLATCPSLMSPSISPVSYSNDSLKKFVGPDTYSRMCSDAIRKSNGVCEVTACPPEHSRLELIPIWRLEEGRDVSLLRFALVSHSLSLAHRLLDLDPASEDFYVGSESLLFINRWDQEDLDVHLRTMKEKRELEAKWVISSLKFIPSA